MAASAGSFLGRLNALRNRYLAFGTSRYKEDVARRLRLLNGVTAVASIIAAIFGIQYALADYDGLFYLYLLNMVTVVVWAMTPLLHRFGENVGAVYFALAVPSAFFAHAYVAGSSAGSHHFILAAPLVMLFMSSRRIWIALPVMSVMMGIFFAIEYGLPEVGAISPMPPEMAARKRPTAIFGAALMILGSIYYALRLAERAEAALADEHARSEQLLLNLMPASIAERLKRNPDTIIADRYDAVTILFADIVDFTPRAGRLSPEGIVAFLNRVFSEFDRIAASHGLEKIKTIGDAYMVAGGMPDRRSGHPAAVADMALDMVAATKAMATGTGETIEIRVGIHTGPAVAGVIGTRKLFYDVWGDTVNTASRMESQGSAGRIQVTQAARDALGDDFVFEARGEVFVKGKGELPLFYLVGRAPDTGGRAMPVSDARAGAGPHEVAPAPG